jgi:hypothetical protein
MKSTTLFLYVLTIAISFCQCNTPANENISMGVMPAPDYKDNGKTITA